MQAIQSKQEAVITDVTAEEQMREAHADVEAARELSALELSLVGGGTIAVAFC